MNYFIVSENCKDTGVEKKIDAQAEALTNLGSYVKLFCLTDRILYRLFIFPITILFKVKKCDTIYYRYSALNFGIHVFLLIFFRYRYTIEINTMNTYELHIMSKINSSSRLKKYLNLLFEKQLYRYSSRILTFTHEIQEYITMIYPCEKVIVIDNGYEIEHVDLAQDTAVAQLLDKKINEGYYIACVAGAFFPWLGLEKICELVSQMPSVFLVIMGNGDNNIQSLLENVHITNRTCYLGKSDRAVLQTVYKSSDFAFATFNLSVKGMKEARTLKMREYLYFGVPVIYNYIESSAIENCPYVYNYMKNPSLESMQKFIVSTRTIKKLNIYEFARTQFDWKLIYKNSYFNDKFKRQRQ